MENKGKYGVPLFLYLSNVKLTLMFTLFTFGLALHQNRGVTVLSGNGCALFVRIFDEKTFDRSVNFLYADPFLVTIRNFQSFNRCLHNEQKYKNASKCRRRN